MSTFLADSLSLFVTFKHLSSTFGCFVTLIVLFFFFLSKQNCDSACLTVLSFLVKIKKKVNAAAQSGRA